MCEVLGQVGTQASLARLHAMEGDAKTRQAAQQAAASILERHPVHATSGSLTLAQTDDIAGALSLAGATPGDVSLYQRAQEVLSAPKSRGLPARRSQTSMTINDGFLNLPAAPRRLPLDIAAYHLIAGPRPRYPGLWLLGLWSTVICSVFTDMARPVALGVGLLAMIFSWVLSQRHNRMLTHGIPTYAEVRDVQHVRRHFKRKNINPYAYRFEFMNEDQELVQVSRTYDNRMPELEDDPLEPALYVGESLVLMDELLGVQIRPDGTLSMNLGWMLLSMLPFLFFWLGLAFTPTLVSWMGL